MRDYISGSFLDPIAKIWGNDQVFTYREIQKKVYKQCGDNKEESLKKKKKTVK